MLGLRHAGNVFPSKTNGAAANLARLPKHSKRGAKQRGFAAARFANNAHNRAPLKGNGDTVKHGVTVVRNTQVFYFENCRHTPYL